MTLGGLTLPSVRTQAQSRQGSQTGLGWEERPWLQQRRVLGACSHGPVGLDAVCLPAEGRRIRRAGGHQAAHEAGAVPARWLLANAPATHTQAACGPSCAREPCSLGEGDQPQTQHSLRLGRPWGRRECPALCLSRGLWAAVVPSPWALSHLLRYVLWRAHCQPTSGMPTLGL